MKSETGTDICTPIFIATLFTYPKGGSNPNVYQWINGLTKYDKGILFSLKK